MAEDFNFQTLTDKQREALGWVLDMAYDDQNSYLSIGNPHLDYGDEWPEAAYQTAEYCRSIAEIAQINGENERWTDLADCFAASGLEYITFEAEKQGIEGAEQLALDPAFMAILAKNVKFFMEHGHGVDPHV